MYSCFRLGFPFVPPHIIYGNFHQFRKDLKNHLVLSEWRQKYGKVFGFFAGEKPTLVVTDLDMVSRYAKLLKYLIL